MKKRILPVLIIYSLCMAPAFAQPNETHTNSFYLVPGIVFGTEIGVNGRVEYEKFGWGKIMYVSELAVSEAFVFDNALGYGYPLHFGPNKALYANGYLSYMLFGGFGVNLQGPTTMLELEYRYRWKFFCVGVGAFYRQMFLFKENPGAFLNFHEKYFEPSVGVRLNFGVYF